MSIQGIYQSEYFTLCSAIGGRNEKSVLRLYVLADILLIIVFSYYIYGSGFMCQEEFNVVYLHVANIESDTIFLTENVSKFEVPYDFFQWKIF